jgi:hypothetical protein
VNDRRAPHIDGPRATYAACTVRGRTRICAPDTDVLPALLALGWTRLDCDDPNIAHVLAPDWMEA